MRPRMGRGGIGLRDFLGSRWPISDWEVSGICPISRRLSIAQSVGGRCDAFRDSVLPHAIWDHMGSVRLTQSLGDYSPPGAIAQRGGGKTILTDQRLVRIGRLPAGRATQLTVEFARHSGRGAHLYHSSWKEWDGTQREEIASYRLGQGKLFNAKDCVSSQSEHLGFYIASGPELLKRDRLRRIDDRLRCHHSCLWPYAMGGLYD
ncbi:hypothetical protein R1flu_014562 [Riccia fluitans]|uniref:Uncharacterized protein n=1 Tax=Riccia fluitans TaxID=41844 RepID=A0ABD1YGG1_9MARC